MPDNSASSESQLNEPQITFLASRQPPLGYYHVILAGLQGGGRCLTGLREHIGDKGYVVASLSTRSGAKPGEYRLKTHYDRLARQLIEQAGGRLIRIYAHSLGGLEVLDLLPALARRRETLPHHTVEVFLISPPGIGLQGLDGLGQIVRKFYSLLKKLGLHDQYQILPMPDETDEQSTQRRKIFLEEWLPRLVTDPLDRKKLAAEIARIDAELGFLREQPRLHLEHAWYERQRHKIMKGLLTKVFVGQHIGEERHLVQLEYCRERDSDRAGRLGRLVLSLAFGGRVLKTLYGGVDHKIVRVTQHCRQLGVKVKLAAVILGQDELVAAQDYNRLVWLSATNGISLRVETFLNEEHSSVAHNWALIDALEELPSLSLHGD